MENLENRKFFEKFIHSKWSYIHRNYVIHFAASSAVTVVNVTSQVKHDDDDLLIKMGLSFSQLELRHNCGLLLGNPTDKKKAKWKNYYITVFFYF